MWRPLTRSQTWIPPTSSWVTSAGLSGLLRIEKRNHFATPGCGQDRAVRRKAECSDPTLVCLIQDRKLAGAPVPDLERFALTASVQVQPLRTRSKEGRGVPRWVP